MKTNVCSCCFVASISFPSGPETEENEKEKKEKKMRRENQLRERGGTERELKFWPRGSLRQSESNLIGG